MFEHPFCFQGRISRTELGLSCVIFCIALLIHSAVSTLVYDIVNVSSQNTVLYIALFLYIPIIWFIIAQNAKRCHDLGRSGWWQIIPLYEFWLIFEDGQRRPNRYGENPKGMRHAGNQIFMQ